MNVDEDIEGGYDRKKGEVQDLGMDGVSNQDRKEQVWTPATKTRRTENSNVALWEGMAEEQSRL
jgi:hypothetical protein